MTQSPTISAPSKRPVVIDAAALRAAGAICRQHATDLHTASFVLPRARRYALYVTAAVIDQLKQILGDRPHTAAHQPGESCETGNCESCPSATTGTQHAATDAAESACASGGGGCETCGESMAQRRQVCAAVMDYLYRAEETGKPELDAFAPLSQSLFIRRTWFDSFVSDTADVLELPRIATWKRLRQRVGQDGATPSAPAAEWLIYAHAALLDPDDEWSTTALAQLSGMANAIRLMDLVYHVADDWRAGRLSLPLDDLVAHRLGEHDVSRFVEASTVGDDPRWPVLMRTLTDRIDKLFVGGRAFALTLRDDRTLREARFLGTVMHLARSRWQNLLDHGGDPFAYQPRLSRWTRMGALLRTP